MSDLLAEMRASLEAARERDRVQAAAAAKHELVITRTKPWGGWVASCACKRFMGRPSMDRPAAIREHTQHVFAVGAVYA